MLDNKSLLVCRIAVHFYLTYFVICLTLHLTKIQQDYYWNDFMEQSQTKITFNHPVFPAYLSAQPWGSIAREATDTCIILKNFIYYR